LLASILIMMSAQMPRGEAMRQLVEFPLEGGGTILVEVDEASIGGPVTRGLGDYRQVPAQAQHTFEDAIARVQPAAQALIGRLRRLADPPDEVGVEFGLELNAEAGAFIASASTTANFKVLLTWRRSASPAATAAQWQGDSDQANARPSQA
jgi:hypothetical protein